MLLRPALVLAVFAIALVEGHQNNPQAYMVPQTHQQPPQHMAPQMGHVPQQQQQQFAGHAHAGAPQPGNPNQNLIRDKAHIQDREHIKEHLQGVLDNPDVSKMTEEELQFHYFKMHDNDDNNKLDGCELIKSLIHWHVEENKQMGAQASPQGTTKIFQDQELATMIDPILDMDDRNKDGFIDYPEFVAAQQSRGF